MIDAQHVVACLCVCVLTGEPTDTHTHFLNAVVGFCGCENKLLILRQKTVVCNLCTFLKFCGVRVTDGPHVKHALTHTQPEATYTHTFTLEAALSSGL